MKKTLSLLSFVLVSAFTVLQAAITVKVKIPSSWEAHYGVYIHYYNTAVGATEWPGVQMTNLGGSWYSYTFPETVTTANIIFNDADDYNYQTYDITNVTSSTCYDLTADDSSCDKKKCYFTHKVVDCPTTETYTMRLNSLSVFWNQAYLYVWSGNDSKGDGSYVSTVVPALLDSEGWFSASFETMSSSIYNVGWSSTQSNYFSGSYVSNISTSTCFEYNNNTLQTTICRSLKPDASNTYTAHVATAGTLGQVMIQKLGDKTWTDVAALTITGSLNEDDMAYFTRMSYLQQLDLSGTDITSIKGCNGLSRLTQVVLPSSCVTINDNAFSGCYRLNDINLANILSVGNNAFYQCISISELNMPKVLSVGNYAFAMSQYDYSYNSSSLKTVNMPIVQTIGAYAFNSNMELTTILIPLVSSIGQYAFCNCYALSQIDLSNVTNLGENAFYMRNNSVNSLDSGNLSEVLLSDELQSIPNGCFNNCPKLTTINLPESLTSIGNDALPYLTNVQLPNNITKVGEGNFINASSISIPAKVLSWTSYSSNWKDVYCHVIVPPTFSVFNTDNANAATLHVPAISLAAYKLHNNWYKFGKIIAMEDAVDDITIDSDFTLLTTSGIATKANVTINNGGALILSADKAIEVGNYEQLISSANKQYNYSDVDDKETGDSYTLYYSYMPYTGMLLANSALTADNVLVKLVPKANQWNFFSLPFDVNMADITIGVVGSGTIGTSQWVIREYSGANRASGNGATWNNVPANGMLKAHIGYILYWVVENSSSYFNNNFSNDYYYDETPILYYFNMPAVKNANMQKIFATGDVSVPLTEYSAEFLQNRSWNLVGNPYPCAFDIQRLDFNVPITTWNGNGYTAYSLEDDNYTLRPAEAFFVQAPQGITQITFRKEGRSVENRKEVTQEEYYNNKNYAPTRNRSALTSNRKVFNFKLSNGVYSDRARLVLNENASANYELTRDAAKMMSSDKTVPQLFINNNGIHYAIDERPENGTFVMGAYFGKQGEYTIHLNAPQNEDRQIILTDTENNVATNLTSGDYTFTTKAGTFDSRFTISFINNTPSEIENASILNAPTKVMENGYLIIMTPQGKKFTVGGIEL